MAVTEDVEQGVLVREGVYGDKVVAVEPGGNEYIPESERHGRPLDLFWTWMSPNIEFATIFVGVIPIVVFGGSFWVTVLGCIVGTALGSITHGLLSAMGPRFGVPQMVQSRAAFGYRGVILPAGLNTLTAGIGWFIVNSVSGTFALVVLTGLDFRIAFTLVVLAQVAVAFAGHNFIHAFERYALIYLGIVFTIAVVIILSKANPGLGFNAKAPVAFGGDQGAFFIATFIAFGYAAGWNPYASDYTRYLPKTVSRFRTGLAAGLGVFVSCAVLEIAGAAAATIGWSNPNPTANFTAPLGDILGKLVLVGILIGAVAANVINVYSGAMSFLTLGIKLGLKQRRAISAVGSGVIGLVIGLAFQANVGPGTKYENFLLAITYWIGPWLGVVFTDYLMRRGNFHESEFFDKTRSGWKGFVAMLAGMIVAVPFWDQGDPIAPGSLPIIGAFPYSHPEWGDLTFVVSFVVAAGIYFALNMGSRRAEAAVTDARPATP
jgi:nucleobase:cation symporter-1, NCS1 family